MIFLTFHQSAFSGLVDFFYSGIVSV